MAQEGKSIFHSPFGIGVDSINDGYEYVLNEFQVVPQELEKRGFTCDETSRVYLWDNSSECINMVGKSYDKFRQADKYLTKYPELSIKQFHHANPVTEELVSSLGVIIENWKAHQKSIGVKVFHNPYNVLKNLLSYGDKVPYFLTVAYWEGEPLHFFLSEQIHDNYIILTDGKLNFGIDRGVLRKVQYLSMLIHNTHLVFWNRIDEPVYYNMGNASVDSSKNHLKPSIVAREHVYHIGKELATSLF
jgi:hypothetical protein